MKSFSAIIKENSKKALANNWGRGITVILVYIAVNVFFTLIHHIVSIAFHLPAFVDIMATPELYLDDIINIDFVAVATTFTVALATFLIVTPLQIGVNGWFFRLVGNERNDVLSMFHFFETTKHLFLSWRLRFVIFFKMCLWGILWMSPGYGLLLYGEFLYQTAAQGTLLMIATVLVLCGIGLFVMGAITTVIYSYRYFLAQYLLFYYRNYTVKKAIKESVCIMEGQKLNVLRFYLSYIGWAIASLFVAPALFAIPYFLTGKAMYARVLIEGNCILEKEMEPPEFEGDSDTVQVDSSPTCEFTPQEK